MQGQGASDTPHYENVPFEVPEGWCWTTIGEVSSSILYGVSESAKESGGYKLLRITDIQDNKVNWDSVPYTDFNEDRVSNYLLHDGDILFARTGATVGKSYLVSNLKTKSIYASYLIRVQTPRHILPGYIKRFFESGYYWEQISLSSVGIGQPNVNGTTLSNLNVPIPPYNEQVRIVEETNRWLELADVLDDNSEYVSKSIESAKSKILDLAIHGKLVPQDANDEPASELLKRINPKAPASCDNPHYQVPYQVPNNWIWCHLKNICAKIVDGDHNPPAGAKGKTSYMMLSSKNINNDSLVDIDNCRFLTFEDWVICNSRTKLTKGDILLTTVATLGRSCVYDSEIPFCFQRSVTVITTMINNYFLKFLFDSPYYQSLMNDSAKGTAQKGFYLNQLEQSLIPVPPMSEQLRIVSKINELFSQLDMIEKSLQA